MNSKFLIIIIGSMLINYFLRVLPAIFYKGKQPSKFISSFLEYIPYTALSALLIPEVIYSTGNKISSIIGIIFAATLVKLKQNMVIAVFGTMILVYIIEIYI